LFGGSLWASSDKLGVLQNRNPEFPADRIHVGFLVDQFANLLPVSTLLALLANRGHVLAPLLNCAQRAAIFRRNGRGKLFGEILRTHGLKDTVGFGSVICAVLVPPVVSSGGSGRLRAAVPPGKRNGGGACEGYAATGAPRMLI